MALSYLILADDKTYWRFLFGDIEKIWRRFVHYEEENDCETFRCFRGLKDALEVRVEDKTCRTIHGTHLEGILSQKNLTGLAGGVKNGQFLVKIWLRSPPQAPEWVNNP